VATGKKQREKTFVYPADHTHPQNTNKGWRRRNVIREVEAGAVHGEHVPSS